jgi:alkanesulfonate monooxygenase SsuD/methylene tetrahydromethanopterin reductase-like flavin-dependent oxidoreductase (luciferase family)
MAQHMPDEWLDAFSAAGTPEQAAVVIQRLAAAGADTVIFQPLDGDPDCLEEYTRDLLPQLKAARHE